ncbi:MAG TPA: FCD domain-containing protein [Mycobacteriales bacterium]|jgi:DNA-binding FadR family transcriptional regulator|nr:FCD domain-containing protein [Mycobacteriales bacterium]
MSEALVQTRAAAARSVVKRAAMLARRIEDDIVAAGWPVGDVLGTEAELMARYDVSRAVLREAVRLVEHHRVAEMRRGPGGGLVVRAPDREGAAKALAVYLAAHGMSVADLMAARRILEPVAIALATERLTEDGIAQLRGSVEVENRESNQTRPAALPSHVHPAIAAMSLNPVLRLFLDILEELSEIYGTRPSEITRAAAIAADLRIREEHAAIVAAIIDGDVARSQRLAVEHLEGITSLLVDPSRAAGAVSPLLAREESKQAELIAERIRSDLAESRLPVGTIVGSENSLRKRYGVSRQILREAVRLLEHHGVAVMRRGPNGGLAIGEADPAAAVEAIAAYLQFREVALTDLRCVRDAIELACVDQVVDLRADPRVVQRLRASLTVDLAGNTSDLIGSVHSIHRELAALTGNPVLVLFLDVLTSLWERRSAHCPADEPAADSTTLAALRAAHSSIAEAVLNGDRGLARLRMLRHVEALTAWWQ